MFCESSHFFHVLSDSKHISVDRNVIRCGGLQARFIQDMKSFARAKSQNVISLHEGKWGKRFSQNHFNKLRSLNQMIMISV